MDFDLREWREKPEAVVNWLLGKGWRTLGDHISTGLTGRYRGRGEAWPDGWRVYLYEDGDDAPFACGPETGPEGMRAASLAILQSRAAWRTPMGFDLILGRWPTREETARHDGASGLWRVGERASRYTGRWVDEVREQGERPPAFCYPLRPDGLPGVLDG